MSELPTRGAQTSDVRASGALKVSRYNTIISTTSSRWLAHNSLSNALGIMDEATHRLYESMVAGTAGAAAAGADESRRIDALRSGMLLQDPAFDEMAYIKYHSRRRRYDQSQLGLTIAPTLCCNFACDYCYEGKRDMVPVMTPDVMEAICGFVSSRQRRPTPLSVSWYGGEPLIALDTVVELDARLSRICAESGSTYRSMMVTNGYLLDDRAIRLLSSTSVTRLQITLDGARDSHDSRRCLKGGTPTFDTIVRNILSLVRSTEIKVSLRVNVDRRNLDGVKQLILELREYGILSHPSVTVHFAPVVESFRVTESFQADQSFPTVQSIPASIPVVQSIPAVQSMTAVESSGCGLSSGSCFAPYHYSSVEVELYSLLVKKGGTATPYPNGRFVNCAALMPASLIVLPDGELHKCWETVGDPAEACGSIFSVKEAMRHPNFIKWVSWEPFENAECRDCHILPICLGGCPYRAMGIVPWSSEKICPTWRYNLEHMLRLFATVKSSALQEATE